MRGLDGVQSPKTFGFRTLHPIYFYPFPSSPKFSIIKLIILMHTKTFFTTFFTFTLLTFVFNQPFSQAETSPTKTAIQDSETISSEIEEIATETETENTTTETDNNEGTEETEENDINNGDIGDSIENEDDFITEDFETKNTEEKPSSKTFTLSPEKQLRITNLAANISNRLDAANNRHSQIVKRITSRTEKLKQQGFNTFKIEDFLEEIEQNLADTKESLKNIDNLVYEMTTSPDPKKEWPKIKTLYQNSVSKITKNQTDLKFILSLLKNPTAQITEENTSETTDLETEEINEEEELFNF